MKTEIEGGGREGGRKENAVMATIATRLVVMATDLQCRQ